MIQNPDLSNLHVQRPFDHLQYVGGIQLYVVRAVELGPCNRGYDTPSSEWREGGGMNGEREGRRERLPPREGEKERKDVLELRGEGVGENGR